MSGPRVALVVLLIGAAALASACGDDDDGGNSADDEALGHLGSTAETATYAYASGGAAALYDYVAQSVMAICTEEQFVADLAGADEPTGFRGMEDAQIDGDEATATVVQIFDTEDRSVEWTFVDEGENTWRITGVPEMDDCLPS